MTPPLHVLVGASIGQHHTEGLDHHTVGALLALATAALDRHTPATYPIPAWRCGHLRPDEPGPDLTRWEHHPLGLSAETAWRRHPSPTGCAGTRN